MRVRWAVPRLPAVGSVVLALTIGAGCAPAGTTSPASTVAAATARPTARPTDSGPTAANPVTLTMTTPAAVLYSPFYVGVEKGIFLKHGIDLKIGVVASGSDATKALQGGQAQFTGNSFPTVVPLVVQGVPLKFFGLVMSRPDVANYDQHLAIVARPGINAASVADLKGLKIASQFGGGSDAWLRAWLRKAGLNPETDVRLINTTNVNMLPALQTQSADVASTTEPYPSLFIAKLPGSKVVVRGGGISDTRIGIVALDTWLTQNPVIVDRLLAGLAEAAQYARQHPDDTGVATSHYLSNLDPDVLTASLKLIDFDPRWSTKVQDGFVTDIQTLVENGTIKTGPKVTDMLALDFLTNTEKKYPQYYNDLK